MNYKIVAMPENGDLDEGNISATGIGLRGGELRAIGAMAESINLSRNALMRIAVRWFILQYRLKKIDLSQFVDEPEPIKCKMRLPS